MFLGPNSLGVLSRPGGYDTLFITPGPRSTRAGPLPRAARRPRVPERGLHRQPAEQPRDAQPRLRGLRRQPDRPDARPTSCCALGRRDDVDTIGVYAEGFADLDGLALLRAISRAEARSARTSCSTRPGGPRPGRSAAAGHTASVAGDYDVCQAAAGHAGALVAETFKEFEQLLELCTLLHGRRVGGKRIGVVSNAGYETVGMADAIQGEHYERRDGHRWPTSRPRAAGRRARGAGTRPASSTCATRST